MRGGETGVETNENVLVGYMNLWLGREINDSFDEIFNDSDYKYVNKNSIKYKELLHKVNYAFPLTYVSHESIPTLCLYGGKDEYIGINHWSLLKTAFKNKKNNNITLDYFKYGTHDVFSDLETEYGINATNKFSKDLDFYFHNYFEAFKNSK